MGRIGQIPWNKGQRGVYSIRTLEVMRDNRRAKFDMILAVDLYLSGLSTKEVGSHAGVSGSAIQRRFKPLGILRPKSIPGKGKGRKFSEAHRQKLSQGASLRIGDKNPFYGKKHKPESLEIMKAKLRLKLSGENNPQWKGGVSQEEYGPEFTEALRRRIKERDGWLCKMCFTNADLVVHHRDLNKKNNSDNNLLTVCRPCHAEIHQFWMVLPWNGGDRVDRI